MTRLAESSRVERVTILTRTFLVTGRVETANAAESTGVTRRTIQRDLAEMSRVMEIQPDYQGAWIYLNFVAREQTELPEISLY